MASTTFEAAPAAVRHRARSPWREALRRFLRKRAAVACLVFLLIVYFAGLLAPWVAPYDFRAQDLDNAGQGPSLSHPLGTDRLGRDIFSRIIWGARTAAIVSIAAVVTGSLVLGMVLGSLAGYFGRWVDTIIMRIGDIFLAFPGLLLVIFIAATLKPRALALAVAVEDSLGVRGIVASGLVDYFVVFGALALFGWVGMARLVRGQMLALKEAQFVEAARALGAGPGRIVFRHMLPNAMGPIIVIVSMAMGGTVTSEVVLSWLGIGIQPPNPSWGTMLWENQGMLRSNPHLLLVPAAVVASVIFAFNILGDGLNDALNPRAR
ncbi:MAG: ABC transporter permease [Chloroflexi bacterium]|nr:ABC transporter permease [Chloroflexota bacterium]